MNKINEIDYFRTIENYGRTLAELKQLQKESKNYDKVEKQVTKLFEKYYNEFINFLEENELPH